MGKCDGIADAKKKEACEKKQKGTSTLKKTTRVSTKKRQEAALKGRKKKTDSIMATRRAGYRDYLKRDSKINKIAKIFKKKTSAEKKAKATKKLNRKINRKRTGSRWNGD